MAYKMEKQSHTSERTGNYRLSEVTASVAAERDTSTVPTNREREASHVKSVIPVSVFENYVLLKKADPKNVFDEYKALPPTDYGRCTVAIKDCNKTKNRYLNMYPYQNRVILNEGNNLETEGNYINASFIEVKNKVLLRDYLYLASYGNTADTYIATQGPFKGTIRDFWRMIWQYNANRIVMVANLVEGGRRMCDSYWPEEINQSEKHEEFIVTLESVVEYADYIVRSLKLRKQLHYGQDESRPIYQYHFTSWKDRGRPSFGAVTLLHFHQEVHSKDDERTGPLVVHCSAGVGRTGTFIALDILLQQVEHERVVDVFGCIQKLREQRMLMVQSQEQAMFLHDAILEAINVGNTSYPCSTMAEEFSKICEEKENGKSELRKQFMLLSKLKSTPEEQINGRVLEESKDKNRDISVIPGELDRPYLTIRHEYQSDYINAVYVDSFRKHDYYVVTQMPLPNTQADFWRLVFDHQLNAIVMLNEMDESDETCKQYWPDGGSGIYGPIKVEHVAVTNISTNIVMRQFMVSLATNKKNDGKLSVRHYQLLGWPNNEVLPPDKDVLLLLMEEVHSWQQKQKYPKHIHKMGHTIVHCLNGVTRCGLFCGVSYIIDKIKLDEKVDVLLAARNVSRNRYQFVRTLDEYRFLYEIALKYIYWCVC